jgi:predicted GNAT family acetyltransferase
MTDEVVVRDRREASRYELTVDGALAGTVAYHDRSTSRILDHTHVDPAFAGRGLGSRLAAAVLDDALDRGMAVVVRCPFLRAFLEQEPAVAERVRRSVAAAREP